WPRFSFVFTHPDTHIMTSICRSRIRKQNKTVIGSVQVIVTDYTGLAYRFHEFVHSLWFSPRQATIVAHSMGSPHFSKIRTHIHQKGTVGSITSSDFHDLALVDPGADHPAHFPGTSVVFAKNGMRSIFERSTSDVAIFVIVAMV